MGAARHPLEHRSAQPAAWFVALVAFALACLGFWGLGVWYDRAATVGRAEARTAAVARLLEEHAARAIEAGDNLVRSLAHAAAEWDLRDREVGRRIWEEFGGRIADSPQFDAAWIMDAEGDTVLDTLRPYPTEPSNHAYRDYYRAHLGPERGLVVGAAGRCEPPAAA